MSISQLRDTSDKGHEYKSIVFVCPGCETVGISGIHMLPVSGDIPPWRPRWDFDGNTDAPTLSPSILTSMNWKGEPFVCHSFIRSGQIEFLSDCTHELAGQTVQLPSLPEGWL